MDISSIAKSILLLAVIGYHGSEASEISVDINHQHLVRSGTNITFICRARDPELAEGEDPSITVAISKLFDGLIDAEPIYLGTSFMEPYKGLPRYVSKNYIEGDTIIHEIKINGVTESDSGELHCVDVSDLGGGDSEPFQVYSDIDMVEFLGMDKNLTVEYGGTINVTCYIHSSIPHAKARIHAGSYDYTEQFGQPQINSYVVQNEGEPTYIDHDTVYTTLSFMPRVDDDGKELTCEAEVPGVRGHFPMRTDSVRLEVTNYPPMFFDCKKEQYANLHQTDVIVNCSVRYNPMGSANWTFSWGTGGGEKVTLAPGESTTDDEITAIKLRDQEGFNFHRMQLKFKETFARHFQTYTLMAKNAHGEKEMQITLVEGDEPAGASALTGSLVAVALTLLMRLF